MLTQIDPLTDEDEYKYKAEPDYFTHATHREYWKRQLLSIFIIMAAAWIGIEIDTVANRRQQDCITQAGSKISAWRIATNEELVIARHVQALSRGRAL